MSTKSNPRVRAYYQDVADLIHIFWQFHLARLGEGEVPVAGQYREDTLSVEEFSFAERISTLIEKGYTSGHLLLFYYSEAFGVPLAADLKVFLAVIKAPFGSLEEMPLYISEDTVKKYERFAEKDYSHMLFRKGEKQFPEVSNFSDHTDFQDMLLSAILNATQIGSQLAVLKFPFGEGYHSDLAAYGLSKISHENVLDSRHQIGMIRIDPETGNCFQDPKYLLLNPLDPSGLNRKQLLSLGAGDSIGCAARLPASKECKDYLEAVCGVEEVPLDVVRPLQQMITDNFDKYMMPWLRGLTREEREVLITPIHHDLLEGRMPEALVRRYGVPDGQCPFIPGGNKERS